MPGSELWNDVGDFTARKKISKMLGNKDTTQAELDANMPSEETSPIPQEKDAIMNSVAVSSKIVIDLDGMYTPSQVSMIRRGLWYPEGWVMITTNASTTIVHHLPNIFYDQVVDEFTDDYRKVDVGFCGVSDLLTVIRCSFFYFAI